LQVLLEQANFVRHEKQRVVQRLIGFILRIVGVVFAQLVDFVEQLFSGQHGENALQIGVI